MRRWLAVVWRSVALASAVLLALTLPAGAAAPLDTLVVGIDEDAITLDPMNFRHRQTETILRNIYDGLVTRTPDMEIVPELPATTNGKFTLLDQRIPDAPTTWA